jgi:glycosyltransferase involved in cell wall biosynthesis
MRLGILVSHPIQYFSPWFRALAQRVDLEVFYADKGSPKNQADAGFGVPFEWDIDLFSGYTHNFLSNVSRRPGTDSYGGSDTPEIAEIIRTHKFDAFIVSGWFLKSYWQAVRACRKNGVPVLVRGDSQLNRNQSPLKRAAKQITHRSALRQFDGFLSVGQRNREYLLHYGVPEDRIFFVPHCVDNDWFATRALEEKKSREQVRDRWGASESTFVILFVGKFIPKKRPVDVLKAAAQLTKGQTRFVSAFVGAGPLEQELRAMASELKISSYFEGFRNQMELPRFYAGADTLVLPSDGTETWGLVVNEGMACGLPAVVSDAVGCGPDLIEEEKTGFTHGVGKERELADRICKIAALKSSGHDFTPALSAKIMDYSLEKAVDGTVRAAQTVVSHGTS